MAATLNPCLSALRRTRPFPSGERGPCCEEHYFDLALIMRCNVRPICLSNFSQESKFFEKSFAS
jgi:hypothetical protein